jgi:putative copper resistance protein D
MALLVDLFGYLSIVLHGLVIVGQSMALGGVLFLIFLARPFAPGLPDGAGLVRRTAVIAGWAAIGLAVGEALTVAMQTLVLMDTLNLPLSGVLGAGFAVAGLVKLTAALLLALLLLAMQAPPAAPLLATNPCCWRPARCISWAPPYGSAASRASSWRWAGCARAPRCAGWGRGSAG